MILRMATPFDTDYSFLNLPEMGSDVRGPIDLPSFEPVDFSFNIDQYAPERLPETELVQPSLDPFSEEENQELLSSARPFEDIQALGATFGQRLAETEKFFGDRISDLQNNISDLEGAKSNLTGELESAISEQDVIRQQSAEEQMQALDAQRAELEAQLQSAVAEAEANGVNALEAAKASAADKIGQLDAEIARTTEDLQNAIAEQDVIRQQADQQRLTELETQKENLTVQFQEQTASLEQKFGAREAELEGQIGNLQGEINALTGARDAALAERDDAIAQQDTIRAEAAEQQAQALDAQAADYQSQLDQITGQVGERDQTIADLQAQLEGLQEAPAGTPQIPDASSIPGFKEQFPYLDLLSKEQPQEVKDMVAKSLATGEPVISQDQIQDMINKMGGKTIPDNLPGRAIPKPNVDQLFIDDRPKFISEERMPRPPRNFGGVNLGGTPSTGSKLDDFVPPPGYKEGPIEGGPAVRPGGPIQIRPINVGGPVVRPGPKPVLKPTKDLIAGGFVKSPIKTPPPRMSVGGIGGFAGGRSGRMIRR